MRYIFVLFLFLNQSCAVTQDCDCAHSFGQLKAGFEANYALFKIKVTEKNRAVYESFVEGVAAKAATTSSADCKKVLESYLEFFQDGHVWIKEVTKDEKSFKSKELTEKDFLQYLTQRGAALHPIEGIWQGEYYKVAIIKDDTSENMAFVGVVLKSQSDSWKPGQIKIELEPQTDGSLQAKYYMGDHSLKELTANLIEQNRILKLKGIGGWSKQMPLAENEEPLDFSQYDTEKPSLQILDTDNILLTIPSFGSEFKSILDTLLHSNHEQLTSTSNLIIDIRENGGGGDATYHDLMQYIYTDTIVLPVGGMYLTERNSAYFRGFFEGTDSTEWEPELVQMLHYMETLNDTLVYWSEDDFFTDTYDTVYTFPKNVAILTSKESFSSAETFVLSAKQSHKVMTFGEKTGAGVDGFNVNSYPIDCYTFQYPTGTRSKFLPVDAVEPLGIRPDFPLDPKDPKLIQKVMQRLSRM
ncbi:MAG: S41 family peptidase [Saprospiraceae bacterium]